MNWLHFCAMIGSFITLLIHIFALSSVFWVYGDIYFFGLWTICVESDCTSYEMSAPAYIHITRAFMLISTATGIITSFVLFVAFYYPTIGSVALTAIAFVPGLLAGTWELIAMAIFTAVSMRRGFLHGSWFSIGFFLGWASVPLFFIVAVLVFKLTIEERDRMVREPAVPSR